MTNPENPLFDERQIEHIVREVLARLSQSTVVSSSSQPPAAAPPAASQLWLGESVVSVRTLADRLTGISTVVVERGAIVTPAARDLLKERNIAVSYAAAKSLPRPRHSVSLAVAETNYDPAGLVRALAGLTAGVERLAQLGLTTVTEELCEAVTKGGQLGLLFTRQPHAAVCLANRRPGVRAAMAGDRLQVAAAVTELGVNLLVVDPAGRSAFEILSVTKEFVRSPARACPPALQSQLD